MRTTSRETRRERGASTVEYGMLVAAVVMGMLFLLGARATIGDLFTSQCAKISACGHCGDCD